MRPALLAPLALFAATGAEARFAPKLDVDYRLTSTATSERDDERNTFTLVRAIRFERRPGGYLAQVTVRSIDVAGEPSVAAQFARAYAALEGVPVAVEVSADGTVGTVRDAELLWATLRRGMMSDDPASAKIAAIFDAIPAPQRSAELASAVTAVIATTDADRRAGTRTTTVPARAFGSQSDDLPARESVSVAGGRVTVDLAADGGTSPGTQIRLARHRVVDRATALTLERHEEVTTTLLVSGARHVSHTVTDHVLTRPVS